MRLLSHIIQFDPINIVATFLSRLESEHQMWKRILIWFEYINFSQLLLLSNFEKVKICRSYQPITCSFFFPLLSHPTWLSTFIQQTHTSASGCWLTNCRVKVIRAVVWMNLLFINTATEGPTQQKNGLACGGSEQIWTCHCRSDWWPVLATGLITRWIVHVGVYMYTHSRAAPSQRKNSMNW